MELAPSPWILVLLPSHSNRIKAFLYLQLLWLCLLFYLSWGFLYFLYGLKLSQLKVQLFLWMSVMVLGGIELIFFIVACIGLCFGFVVKTVWIVCAEQCLHRVKAFSASLTTPPTSRLGMHKTLEEETAGTADLN